MPLNSACCIIHVWGAGPERCTNAACLWNRSLHPEGSHEEEQLPTELGFDPEYKRQAPPTQKFGAVSPVFAEWLMGLPREWTSVTPLASAQRPLQDCRFLSSSPGTKACQQQSRRWKSISIFSGCGALDLGLAPWVEPLLYCEIDLAAKNGSSSENGRCEPPNWLDRSSMISQMSRARDWMHCQRRRKSW